MTCPSRRRNGFSLVELLVAIGIIVILIGILVPVVGRVREAGRRADTQSLINQLQTAIEAYYQVHRAYPGPLPNTALGTEHGGGAALTINGLPNPQNTRITGSENLVLGLMGGLYYNTGTGGGPVGITFAPNRVGRGPAGLNPQAPKTYEPYLTGAALSEGFYSDEVTSAADSSIPEILDRFLSPMPVLYLRSRVGVPTSTTATDTDNPVIEHGTNEAAFELGHILGYTSTLIGEGKSLPRAYDNGSAVNMNPPQHGLQTIGVGRSISANSANYTLPYPAYPYFANPSAPNTARQKDRYILISAGSDRIYGTDDDITNFGSVAP